MAEDSIRLVMHNADPRSCAILQDALKAEGLTFEYEPPMEYRSIGQEFGEAVFIIATGTVTAVTGSLASDAARAGVRRAIAKLRDNGSPAGPFEGPDDIIPHD